MELLGEAMYPACYTYDTDHRDVEGLQDSGAREELVESVGILLCGPLQCESLDRAVNTNHNVLGTDDVDDSCYLAKMLIRRVDHGHVVFALLYVQWRRRLPFLMEKKAVMKNGIDGEIEINERNWWR